MNMPAMNELTNTEHGTTTLGFDKFINEEVSILKALNDKRLHELMTYSKSFLDKVFH